MRWVQLIRDTCDAPADVRAFLMVLASYADAEGVCWPSLDTLARNLGIHRDSAKRRRDRAVSSGWLVILAPGRWKGTRTRYQLQTKGSVHAPLPSAQRGAPVLAKGVRGYPLKGGVDTPRTTKKFQEGVDAPSLGRRSPLEERRELARAIRESPPTNRDRFRATFTRTYGHLYRRTA